jgi:hypothetical protein
VRASLAALALVVQPAIADPVTDILAEARDFCESYENGVFDEGDAVTEIDLDGEGAPDLVVDEGKFSCSSMASAYCGTGGCMIHTVIGDRAWTFQSEGWQVTDWAGSRILLIARDGGWCGGAGAQLCFEAVTWSDGEMLTVMPPAP